MIYLGDGLLSLLEKERRQKVQKVVFDEKKLTINHSDKLGHGKCSS